MRLLFATGNKHKLAEAQRILPHIEQLAIELDEVQSVRYEDIISRKLSQAAAAAPDAIVIVEDAGFHLACLNGFPGPLIKWLLEAVGSEGVYGLASRAGEMAATGKAVFGVQLPGGEQRFFGGEVAGTVVEPGADNGFGWDRIFIPDGSEKRFSELTADEKNLVSHRGKALAQLKAFLETR